MQTDRALSEEELGEMVRGVTSRFIETTIDIPQIAVLPTREVNYGFRDFDLEDLGKINFQPASREMQLHHLDDNRRDSIRWDADDGDTELRLEDYLVRQLMNHDAIDYDEHAALLYKLAGQVVGRLRSYLQEPEQLRSTVIAWQRQLADFIWAQMQQNQWTTPTGYVGRVVQGFEVLKPATFTLAAGEQPRPFREPVQNKRDIRLLVFKGFAKCCYPYQKFQSVDGEWRLAQVLEDDAAVLRWMKPAPGQFRIEWLAGRNYEPDFVVELTDRMLLIEPKQSDKVEDEEVQAKMRAAVRWCGYASEHAAQTGGKPWSYLLVPADAIHLGASIAGLCALHTRH